MFMSRFRICGWICCALCWQGAVSNVNGQLLWNWSFNDGTEQGQIETTGTVADLAAAGSFTVTNMSLTATSTSATLGDVLNGPYSFSTTISGPPFSLDWNGSNVSAFHDVNDTLGAPGLIEMRDSTPGLLTQVYLGFNFSSFQGGLSLAEVATTGGIVSTAFGAGPLTVTPTIAPPPRQNPLVEALALEGEIAPSGNGFFGNLGGVSPSISDDNFVAFATRLTGSSGGTDDDAILVQASDINTLTKIAREGEALDAGNQQFYIDFNQVLVGEEGITAFQPLVDSPSQNQFQNTAIMRGDGSAPPTRIVLEGEAEPGADSAVFETFEQLSMTNGGLLAWRSDLRNAQSSAGGIYRSGGGSITTIVRAQRDGLDDGSEFERNFGVPVINNNSHVAFRTNLTDTPGGTTDDSAIFRGFFEKEPVLIVREGDTAVGGDGQYASFSDVGLNDEDQVVFTAQLRNTSGESADDRGLYRGNENFMIELARKGDASPDGVGVLDSFLTPLQGGPEINNSNDVAVRVSLSGTDVDNDNNRAILFSDENGLSLLAREGNAAPGGGKFSGSFGEPVLNNLGQVVFTDLLSGAGIDDFNNFGLYAFDPTLGLLKLFREGDFVDLGGGDLRMIDSGGISFGENGLNDSGVLAVGLEFTDGTSGVFRSRIAKVITPLPGDFDGDGDVDHDDLAQWRGDFGINDSSDANNDGDSDGQDFLAWQANFNGSVNSLGALQTVPEPSGLFLLLTAIAICRPVAHRATHR